MKAYKGFGKDMKCRGYQFEEGIAYETERAKLCEEGFHACEMPLDTMTYYYPTESEYHEVDLDGITGEKSYDSKVCGTKIKIWARLSINDLVKAEIEIIRKKVKDTTGDRAHVATTGDGAHAATTGYAAHAVTAWDRAHAVTTGYAAHAATTGYAAHAATTGKCAHAATTGDGAHAATTGDRAHAVTAGDRAHAATKGKNSIAVAIGIDSVAKAKVGSWIVLAEYDNSYKLVSVKAVQIDGIKYLPDVSYKLKNGEVIKDENDETD